MADDGYKVGDRHPPLETRFSSTNQPKGKRGRKKGSLSLMKLIREQLEKVKANPRNPKEKRTYAELLAEAAILQAIKGRSHYFKENIARVDGAMPQAPALPEGVTLTIVNSVPDEDEPPSAKPKPARPSRR